MEARRRAEAGAFRRVFSRGLSDFGREREQEEKARRFKRRVVLFRDGGEFEVVFGVEDSDFLFALFVGFGLDGVKADEVSEPIEDNADGFDLGVGSERFFLRVSVVVELLWDGFVFHNVKELVEGVDGAFDVKGAFPLGDFAEIGFDPFGDEVWVETRFGGAEFWVHSRGDERHSETFFVDEVRDSVFLFLFARV